MPNTQTRIASFINHHVKRRACTQCDGIMTLTCIEPGAPGVDIRTFECRNCHRIERHSVEIDPMISGAAGWVSSHLHAPR